MSIGKPDSLSIAPRVVDLRRKWAFPLVEHLLTRPAEHVELRPVLCPAIYDFARAQETGGRRFLLVVENELRNDMALEKLVGLLTESACSLDSHIA
jgi:hypothetical protein